MFTGIVETTGTVSALQTEGDNLHLHIRSTLGLELKIDQSVSHNGVCLTVTAVEGDIHTLTAVRETLNRSNLGGLSVGDRVNLERCMPANGRLDGHIVQGHVDCTAVLMRTEAENGSYRLWFRYPENAGITVEKGSVCVNGVSLTVVDSQPGEFSVVIIPYTWEHTNLSDLKTGDPVNIEFDILGKYMEALLKRSGRI